MVLFLVLKEKRPEETGAKMADIWIMRARNEAKTGGLHLLDLSLSERKTAGSQYLCGFPFVVLAKCLQFLVATSWL